MRKPRWLLPAVLLSSLTLGLSGCATGAPPQSQTRTLDVTVATGTALPTQTVRQFTKRTGIHVRVHHAGTDLQLARRVRAGTLQTDVVLGLTAPNLSRLGDGKNLLPYTSTDSGKGAIDFQYVRSNRLTAISYDYVCAVSSARDAPTSLSSFPSVQYRGQVTLPNPERSSAGLTFVLTANSQTTPNGGTAWKAYWRRLAANGLHLSNTAAAAGDTNTRSPIRIVSPTHTATAVDDVIGSTCTRRTRYAAISVSSTHVNAAKTFIDALLGTAAQRRISETGDYPVTSGVKITTRQRRIQKFWEHNGEDNTDAAVSDTQIPTMLREWQQLIGQP